MASAIRWHAADCDHWLMTMTPGLTVCPIPRISPRRMLFPTSKFLAFFVVAFAVYWLLGRHRRRMLWLTAASAFFYMSWNPWFILLILGSTSVDYFVALRLPQVESPHARKWLVALSVTVNLG